MIWLYVVLSYKLRLMHVNDNQNIVWHVASALLGKQHWVCLFVLYFLVSRIIIASCL